MSTKWARRLFKWPTSAPRRFPTSGFWPLDHVEKLEEENWDWYSPQMFYPAKIGEVLTSRYQILGKLGYGAHSTAWLGRDLLYVHIAHCRDRRRATLTRACSAHEYVAMKICEKDSTSSAKELAAYQHLQTITTVKPGALFLRKLHDSFKIQGLEAEHLCLVHEPLGVSLETFRTVMPAKQLPEALLKAVLEHLLQALDCLHSDAKMIHTGELHITPRNSSQDFVL
jgi:serine/threonine-protein kinase SRPK3